MKKLYIVPCPVCGLDRCPKCQSHCFQVIKRRALGENELKTITKCADCGFSEKRYYVLTYAAGDLIEIKEKLKV